MMPNIVQNHPTKNELAYFEVPHQVFDLGLSDSQLVYLVILFKLRDEAGTHAFKVSGERMREISRLSPSTLKRVRRALLLKGLIRDRGRGGKRIFEITA